jgi:hypothetical protein
MAPSDQRYYDIIAEEFRARRLVDGLWIRSFSEAAGDESKARALYIGYRVEQLKAAEKAEQATSEQQAASEWRRQHEERVRAMRESRESRSRQAQAARLHREEVARERRETRVQQLEVERRRPLEPGARRLLLALIILSVLLFFLLIFPILR